MSELGAWLCARGRHRWRLESRPYAANTIQLRDGIPTNPFELIRQVKVCKRCDVFADPADVPGNFAEKDE